MTKKELKAAIKNDTARPVAYISACGGIEIYTRNYSVNDEVLFTAGAWSGKTTVHRARVRYSAKKDDEFFIFRSYRLYFSDAVRMGWVS